MPQLGQWQYPQQPVQQFHQPAHQQQAPWYPQQMPLPQQYQLPVQQPYPQPYRQQIQPQHQPQPQQFQQFQQFQQYQPQPQQFQPQARLQPPQHQPAQPAQPPRLPLQVQQFRHQPHLRVQEPASASARKTSTNPLLENKPTTWNSFRLEYPSGEFPIPKKDHVKVGCMIGVLDGKPVTIDLSRKDIAHYKNQIGSDEQRMNVVDYLLKRTAEQVDAGSGKCPNVHVRIGGEDVDLAGLQRRGFDISKAAGQTFENNTGHTVDPMRMANKGFMDHADKLAKLHRRTKAKAEASQQQASSSQQASSWKAFGKDLWKDTKQVFNNKVEEWKDSSVFTGSQGHKKFRSD